MRPWLKAGLTGSIVLSVLTLSTTLMYLVPLEIGAIVGSCACLPFFLVYPAIGVLAALWMPPPRSAGQGAQAGALAGLVAGVVDGIVTVVWMLVLVLLGISQRYLAQFSPAMLYSLKKSGMYFLFTPSGLMATALCNAVIFIAWAAVFGALGGAIYAAIKRE